MEYSVVKAVKEFMKDKSVKWQIIGNITEICEFTLSAAFERTDLEFYDILFP